MHVEKDMFKDFNLRIVQFTGWVDGGGVWTKSVKFHNFL